MDDIRQEAYNFLKSELDKLKETFPKLDYLPIGTDNKPMLVTNIPIGIENLYIAINNNGDRELYIGPPQSKRILKDKTLKDIADQINPENMTPLVQDFNERLKRNPSAGGRGLS